MKKSDDQIVLVDTASRVVCGTDLHPEDAIIDAHIKNNILTLQTLDANTHTYIMT